MKGHLKERSPGHLAIVLDVRDPATGKTRRRWHSFRGSASATPKSNARAWSPALKGGTYIDPNKTTLAEFFARWLEHIRSQVSPRTFERYCEIINKNIMPSLGGTPLTRLRPAQISEAYARRWRRGRRDGKGGLSAATVLYMHESSNTRWPTRCAGNCCCAIRPLPSIRRRSSAAAMLDLRHGADGRAVGDIARQPPVRAGHARRPLRAAPWRDLRAALAPRRSRRRRAVLWSRARSKQRLACA